MADDGKARGGLSVTVDATEALNKGTDFVIGVVDGPFTEISGIVTDILKFVHDGPGRLALLASQVYDKLKGRQLDGPTRQIPPKVGLPLLRAAVLEEDEQLRELWVALLANAADAGSGIKVRRQYISILEDLEPLDARCLLTIVEATTKDQPKHELYFSNADIEVATSALPDYVEVNPPRSSCDIDDPDPEVDLSLLNLRRLGLIESMTMWTGTALRFVKPTRLGVALVRACTEPPRHG